MTEIRTSHISSAHILECSLIREWQSLRRIRMFGFVGVGVVLSEVGTLGVGFEASKVQVKLSVYLSFSLWIRR